MIRKRSNGRQQNINIQTLSDLDANNPSDHDIEKDKSENQDVEVVIGKREELDDLSFNTEQQAIVRNI